MVDTPVKELMVPLEEYATVSVEGTLYEAVLSFEKSKMRLDPSKHKNRAILVLDNEGRVVGKLSMLDILISLEPKYRDLEISEMSSRSGLSEEFIKSMLESKMFWEKPLPLICTMAADINVSEIMRVPEEGFYIDQEATLGEASHRMIVLGQQSLLVTGESGVVGVLRLSDVFTQFCETIMACKA